MNIKKELLEIPHALEQMLEEGRPQYDALIRSVSWTERPVFMIGAGSSYEAALSGACAFEAVLGMPVIVRRPAAFNAYTASALTPRSLLIVISDLDDSEETLLAAKKAKNRGATVWVVAADPAGELARMADAQVNCYSGEPSAEDVRAAFCRHAVMLFLAVAAARILKGASPQLSAQEEELASLPRHVEWMLNQIPDAGRALAGELRQVPEVFVVGGGLFHPAALQAAHHLANLAGIHASGFEPVDFGQLFPRISQPGAGILFLSSSRCRLKAQVHQSVRQFRQKGDQKIFAITDRNDRQLSERATLAVFLPALTEAAGALMALAFAGLVTHYATEAPVKRSRRHA